MKKVWGDFWKTSGKFIEWNKEDILNSRSLAEIFQSLCSYFHKKNLRGYRLLELGAGIGLTSYFFAKKGADITLLDNSKEAKKQAEEWWEKTKHKYIVGNLFKYNEKKFDIIISFGLCEHFTGKKRKLVLQKHIDLLRDKGVAIISVPYRYGIFYRIGKFLAEITKQWSFGVEVPFSKGELKELVIKNDLAYEIKMCGFYSSFYDLAVRKPLKMFGLRLKRRFDNAKSLFDSLFGSSLIIILKK